MFGSDRLRKRVRDLEERLEQLELSHKSDRLGVLEVIEKISQRLEWRERKRQGAQLELERTANEDDGHALGFTRRFGGNGGR